MFLAPVELKIGVNASTCYEIGVNAIESPVKIWLTLAGGGVISESENSRIMHMHTKRLLNSVVVGRDNHNYPKFIGE